MIQPRALVFATILLLAGCDQQRMLWNNCAYMLKDKSADDIERLCGKRPT